MEVVAVGEPVAVVVFAVVALWRAIAFAQPDLVLAVRAVGVVPVCPAVGVVIQAVVAAQGLRIGRGVEAQVVG